MSIFSNKNVPINKSPYLESFNMESFEYKLLHDIQFDSFNIALEFNRTVYCGIKNNDIEIVNEGFNEFFEKAAKFFKDLALKILDFAKNYMKYFVSYFQDFDRFLKKNKDHIKSLDINFSYSGYEYNFPKEVPNLTKVDDIIGSFNYQISRVDTLTYSDVSKMRDEFSSEVYKNKIRASILNIDGKEVSADTFKEKSKRTFVKTKDPITLNINNSYVSKIVDEYSDLKNLLESTENTKNKIIKLLHELEYFFDKKATVVYDKEKKVIKTSSLDKTNNELNRSSTVSINFDSDKLTTLNSYFDLKYKESKFISNCMVNVYMDKINSIKECMNQYRTIIRKCLVDKKDNPQNVKSEVK